MNNKSVLLVLYVTLMLILPLFSTAYPQDSYEGGADRMIKVFDKIQLFKFENARVFFKAGKDESTWGNVNRFVKVTSENSRYINKFTEFFPEDALAATIKNMDDYEGMAVGTKRIMGKFENGLGEFENSFKVCSSPCKLPTKADSADFVKKLGKLDPKTAEHITDIADVKGVNKLTDKILKDTRGGFEFEAELASKLKKEGKVLEEVDMEIINKFGKTDVDSFLKNGDIHEAKKLDWGNYKPGSTNYNKLKADLGTKIKIFEEFQQANGFIDSKITIVFKSSVESGIENWLKSTKNVLVEVIP